VIIQKLTKNLDEILANNEENDIVEIIKRSVFLSNISVMSNFQILKNEGITHWINWSASETKVKHPGMSYFDMRLDDSPNSNLLEGLENVTKYIAEIKGKQTKHSKLLNGIKLSNVKSHQNFMFLR
jgi:hypothetical protein